MFNTRYDHLVAIERSGRAGDGNYYNMRGVNIKHLVDPIDDLFVAAKDIAGITTTGSQHTLHMYLNLCYCCGFGIQVVVKIPTFSQTKTSP